MVGIQKFLCQRSCQIIWIHNEFQRWEGTTFLPFTAFFSSSYLLGMESCRQGIQQSRIPMSSLVETRQRRLSMERQMIACNMDCTWLEKVPLPLDNFRNRSSTTWSGKQLWLQFTMTPPCHIWPIANSRVSSGITRRKCATIKGKNKNFPPEDWRAIIRGNDTTEPLDKKRGQDSLLC